MTKTELIKALAPYGDDNLVTLGDAHSGWSNIEEVKGDGMFIAIMPETERPFTSDNA